MRRGLALLAVLLAIVFVFVLPAAAYAADTGFRPEAAKVAAEYLPALQSVAVIVGLVKGIRYLRPSLDGGWVVGTAVAVGILLNLGVYFLAGAGWFAYVAKGAIDALSAVGVFTGVQAASRGEPIITTVKAG